MTHTLLPASVLPGLLEVALRNRINAQAIFAAAGIDAESVGRADRFIDLEQMDALLEAAFRLGGDPFFGLVVGKDLSHTHLDLLGNLMATAGTFHEALEAFMHYKNLVVPWLEFTLVAGNERARLDVMPDPRLRFAQCRPHNELVMGGMVGVGRSLLGGRLPIRCAGFMHGEPSDLRLYHEVFGECLEFDCETNRLEVDRTVLGTALPSAWPRYHQRLRQLADQAMSGLGRAQGVSGRVLVLLEQRLGSGDTSIEAVAAALDMTPRTLQRRLSQEDNTFAGLRDAVRHRRACELLGEDQLDMAAIAARLGFSDTANFYHAFRRWEGCAPGEYRRSHRRP